MSVMAGAIEMSFLVIVPVTVLGGAIPEVGRSGVLTPCVVRPRTPLTSIVH